MTVLDVAILYKRHTSSPQSQCIDTPTNRSNSQQEFVYPASMQMSCLAAILAGPKNLSQTREDAAEPLGRIEADCQYAECRECIGWHTFLPPPRWPRKASNMTPIGYTSNAY